MQSHPRQRRPAQAHIAAPPRSPLGASKVEPSARCLLRSSLRCDAVNWMPRSYCERAPALSCAALAAADTWFWAGAANAGCVSVQLSSADRCKPGAGTWPAANNAATHALVLDGSSVYGCKSLLVCFFRHLVLLQLLRRGQVAAGAPAARRLCGHHRLKHGVRLQLLLLPLLQHTAIN